MATIRVQTTIDAPPSKVWAHVEDIASHVRWMQDARAIRFTGTRRTGVGTTFECDTQVGPVRLTDSMEVTEWEPPRSMAVRHRLPVHGTGRFELAPAPDRPGATVFAWHEDLRFPWWLGQRLGAAVAAPVMARIWGRSVAQLRELVESTGAW